MGQRTSHLTSTRALELRDRQSEYEKRSFSLCLDRRNSMSAHTLDLSTLQRSVWDMERRYGETCNPDTPRFSLLLNRMVFTPRKDPLRPLPVLAVDCSQEASGASPRKRLSDRVCSRPLKPALVSLRKLVSLDLWPIPHAEQRATRLASSPSSLHHLLPTYLPLFLTTSNGVLGQVQRVREAHRLRPPSGATRTSIENLQPRSGRTGRESNQTRPFVSRRHVRATCSCVPVPFVWKPVSPTSSAAQASVFRAEVSSIRPPFWCNAH